MHTNISYYILVLYNSCLASVKMVKNSFNSCESIERASTINDLGLTVQEMYVKLEGTKFFTLETEYFFSFPCASECSINGSQ